MRRNRESAEAREEKKIQKEEKAEKRKKDKEKKNERRGNNRLKKQEKKVLKSRVDIQEGNSEVIGEILQDNQLLRQKKIICFDLYGTLIFRPHSHGKTKHFLKKVGIEPFKKYYNVIQTNRKENVDSTYYSVSGFKMPKSALRKLQEHTDDEVKNTKIYPETLTVLNKLKNCGYKLALISNLSQDFEKPLRKLIPEGIFDYEALSYDVGVTKPDNAIFEKVLKDANGEIDNTDGANALTMNDFMMIGDSRKSDVGGAQKVGMDGILLDRNTEKISYDKEKKLITIHTLADLLDILGIEY